MKAEFKIKISVVDMYRFLMYHTYHGFHGIFSVLAGLALLAVYFVRRGTLTNSWIYLGFGILFLVYLPWTLYTKAMQQVKLGTVFKEPLLYTVTEEGITVCQGEAANQIGWDTVWKVRETGKNILVYTSKRNAFIWVKSQMGQEKETASALIRSCVENRKVLMR